MVMAGSGPGISRACADTGLPLQQAAWPGSGSDRPGRPDGLPGVDDDGVWVLLDSSWPIRLLVP